MACISEAGLLRHRKSIEFGTDHDRRARATLQYANHTGAADSRGHVEPEMTELVGYPGSRFLLMQREFRVAMQVHVERFDLWVDAIDLVFGRRTPGISGKQRRN